MVKISKPPFSSPIKTEVTKEQFEKMAKAMGQYWQDGEYCEVMIGMTVFRYKGVL